MDPLPGPPIRPVRQVAEDHIRETLAAHPDVSLERLAVELGLSFSTLMRKRRAWAGEGESLMRDRR